MWAGWFSRAIGFSAWSSLARPSSDGPGPHLAGEDVEPLVAVHVEQAGTFEMATAPDATAPDTDRFSNGTGSRLTGGQGSGSGSFAGALAS